jgi:hypothetical protein
MIHYVLIFFPASDDTPDIWTIPNNTIVCFQIIQRASTENWGTLKYKFEGGLNYLLDPIRIHARCDLTVHVMNCWCYVPIRLY